MRKQIDKSKLDPELVKVAFEGGTEPPFSGKYHEEKGEGTYHCAVCGQELFHSRVKYDSGSGWPSFTEPIADSKIELRHDTSHGMVRTEVVCANCGAHLGHVFDDGPKDRGGKRYCINSISLDMDKKP